MKKVLTLVFVLIGLSSFAQREFTMTEGDTTYTMKQYIMCFLKSGPERGGDSIYVAKIQEGHLAHLNKLAQDGKVTLVGPFGDDTELRGIVLFDVETIEEARKLQSQDPAVKAGRLVMEFHPWWGAKGTVLK